MRVFTHRPAPLVALIAAVAVGAALVAACAGLLETAMRLDAPPQRLAGADLVVAAGEHATLAADGGAGASTVTLSERPRLAAGVVAKVVSVPGVARAVPTSAGTPGALAVTVRDGVSVSRLKASIAGRLHGRHLSVLTGDDRGRAEATGVAAGRLTLILLAGIFGGMALIVMAILLGSIISLSVQQRRRELGLLRALGATPRQVRRMVVARTMRPATAAAAAGALAGPALGRALWDRLQGGGVVPDVLALRQSVLAVAAGAVAAWLATRLSVGIAARRAGHARLGDALGEAETPAEIGKIRMGFAIFAASGAASCATITMFMPPENAAATGGGTALGGAIACALLAPRLADRLAARLLDTARRLAGLPGALAVVNVRARAHQTGALVTPVILVVAIALANVYQQTTQGDAMRSAFLNDLKADAVVTATDGHAITAQVAGAARRAGATSALVTSKGWIEHPVDTAHRSDPRPLVGVDAPASAAKVASGSLSALHGDAVALPQVVAEKLDIKIGDRVGLVLGDGAHVRVAVVALLGGASRYAPIVLPPSLLAAHTTGGVRRLLVNGDGDVRARLARALGAQPGVTVRGSHALADDVDTGLEVDLWITLAVVAVIVAYAAMSLVNLVIAALGGRRRELALLRLAGATKAQVATMLRAEALLIAAIGGALGTAVAIAGLVPLSVATAGSPLPSGPIWIFPAVLALATGLVLVPTIAVTRMTLRHRAAAEVERP